jgi:hypothetical protein
MDNKFNFTGISSTRIETPPPPNWRFYFGDSVKDNIQWNIRIDNPPNRFQRWLCYKAFRLTWEEIK